MFRTDQQTAVASIPAPAIASTPGYFSGGNPATGQPATILDADWLNMVQEELMSILAAAGLTPSKVTYSQVLAAINVLIGKSTNANGSSIYYVGTPTSGSVTTFTRSLTFVAPSNGVVMATQSMNIGFGGVQPGAQTNTVKVTGSVSGSGTGTDTTTSNITNSIVKNVVAGETVTVMGSLVSNGATGSWSTDGITLSYIFVPTN